MRKNSYKKFRLALLAGFPQSWKILENLGKKSWKSVVQIRLSEPRVFQLLLVDPTQVESKKCSQIQWPVPSINAEPVDIFLGEE